MLAPMRPNPIMPSFISFPFSSLPLQPSPQPRSDRWSHTCAGIGVGCHLDRLALGRIGMNDTRERAEPYPRDHRQGYFVDHVARMAGNDRCAENPVSALLDVNLYEAHLFTVGDRAIHFMHRY